MKLIAGESALIQTEAGDRPETLHIVPAFVNGCSVPAVTVWEVRNSARCWRENHETWKLCAVHSGQPGLADWTYRGHRGMSGAGDIMAMEPGNKHFTHDVSCKCAFTLISIRPELVNALRESNGWGKHGHLVDGHLRDRELLGAVIRLSRAIVNQESCGSIHEAVIECVGLLQSRLGNVATPPKDFVVHRSLRRVREFIDRASAAEYSLERLSELAGLSVYHLLREFKRATGATPQQWRDARRMTYARALLERGVRAAEVAERLGTTPQYFSRRFRAFWGVPPSQWPTLQR